MFTHDYSITPLAYDVIIVASTGMYWRLAGLTRSVDTQDAEVRQQHLSMAVAMFSSCKHLG